MKKMIGLIIAAVFQVGCSVFGIRSEETPKYAVLQADGDVEIREYAPHIVAMTEIAGNYDEAQSQGFRILAGYIFGANEKQEKIAMTAPVVQAKQASQDNSEKIAMTAPVVQKQTKAGWEMTFSMPSKYKLEDLPKPKDSRVQLKMTEVKKIAVLNFTGFWSESKISKLGEKLAGWIKSNGQYEPVSVPMFAGYNPPWTLPFFRKNEIMIEVTAKP